MEVYSSTLYPGGGMSIPKSRFLLPVGRYSVFGKTAITSSMDKRVKETTRTALFLTLVIICSVKLFINPDTLPAKPSSRDIKPRRSRPSTPFADRYFEDADGMTVMETRRLSITETLIAMAMSRNSCPVCSSMNIMGMNTAAVVRVLASTAPQTSVVPS